MAEAAQEGEPFIKIASRQEEWTGAFRLVHDAYVDRGLIVANPYRMRVTPYHLLHSTEVLVALQQGRVICTVSLVGDGDLGLPMEVIYDREIALRRAQGLCLAEVSCLADRRQESESSRSALFRLMSFTAQLSRHRIIDELLITVHPRHAAFYVKFLGFQSIGEVREYPAVCDHPAVPLALDLNRLAVQHPRAYRRLFGTPFSATRFDDSPMPADFRAQLQPVAEGYFWGGSPEPEEDHVAAPR
jgi:hypothetical protein